MEIKEGDLLLRIWKSGKITKGRATMFNGELYFESLEDYDNEGGVIKNELYGLIDYYNYESLVIDKSEIRKQKIKEILN
jgi:hypothetical protein